MKNKRKSILTRWVSIMLCIVLTITSIHFTKVADNEIAAATADTTINLTGLVTGEDATHTCIYKTKYDSSYHWSECIICSKVKDKKAHNKIEKWANETAPKCSSVNLCTTYCSDNCGYSTTYRKPHTPAGAYYQTYQNWYHYQVCSTCHQWSSYVFCTKADGSMITCENLGTCVGCGHTYTQKKHYIYGDGTCTKCNKKILTHYTKSVTYSSDRRTATIVYHVKPNYKVTSESIGAWSGSGGISLESSSYVKNSDGSYDITLVCKITTYPYQIQLYMQPRMNLEIDGAVCMFHGYNVNIYPDATAPTVNVTQTNVTTSNGWATSKKITVTGSEAYSTSVYVSMQDAAGNVIYPESHAAVTGGSYNFSFIPQLEASSDTTFYVVVRDPSNNVTKKAVTISKVDSMPPTMTSDVSYKTGWSSTKEVTITTKDSGIGTTGSGSVYIGFNSESEMKVANYSDGVYSRKYIFTGDVYDSVVGAVYIKDSLGNISTKTIEIGKIDGTKPTITNTSVASEKHKATITVTANDKHETLGEGSGVSKYAITTSNTAPTSGWQDSNVLTVNTSGTYYVWVKDAAGNVSSKSVEVIVKYQVTYDVTTNGGAGTNETVILSEGDVIDLTHTGTKVGDTGTYSVSNPDGWQFVGWNTNKDATSAITEATIGSSDVTLYAIFKKVVTLTEVDCSRTRTLTGEVYNNKTSYSFATESISPYDGWEILGWTSKTDATSDVDVLAGKNISLTKDTIIYAKYNRIITLSYNTQGGDTTPSTETFIQEVNSYDIDNITSKELKLASAINKTGFTFIEWGENSVTGSKYLADSKYILTATTTMHAVWERNKYKVTYDYSTNGGTSSSVHSDEVYYDYDIDLSPIATKDGDTGIYDDDINKDGWKFIGWNTDPNATVGLSSMKMPAHDVTLYAIYSKDIVLTVKDMLGSLYNTDTYKYTVYNNTNTISYTFNDINKSTYSSGSGEWKALGWTTKTTASGDIEYEVGMSYNFNCDTSLYALYERDLAMNFVSIYGEEESTQTITEKQYLNSYDAVKVTSPTFVAPDIYKYTGDSINGSWTAYGWTLEKNTSLDKIIKEGDSLSHTVIKTYYAVYTRDLTVKYTDYLGETKEVTEESAVQVANAYNIENYYNPTIVLKEINAFVGWEPSFWTVDEDGLTMDFNEKTSMILDKNMELFAVYNRKVNITFADATYNNVMKKTQYANASDIEGSKSEVKVVAPNISEYTDDSGYTWVGKFWTLDNKNNVTSGVDVLKEIVVKEDTTYYALYGSTYIANFVSINRTNRASQSVSGIAYANSYDMSDILNPTIAAPSLKKCTYTSLSWSSIGWAIDTNSDADVLVGENEDIVLTGNTKFYGIYSTGVDVTFIDYEDNEERTRILKIGKRMNSYDLSQTIDAFKTPTIGIYTDDNGEDWIIRGWTNSKEPSAAIQFYPDDDFNLDEGTVFYAVYEKTVELTLVDYSDKNEKETVLKNKIYTNSSDISNIQKATFTLPIQNKCTIDEKTWLGRGWTSNKEGMLPEFLPQTSIELETDTTIYGLYNTTITVTYDGNGGSSIPSQTGTKILNGAGYEKNPSIVIPATKPVRKGYLFNDLWRIATNCGTEYVPGQAYEFTRDITIYAQWSIEVVDKTVTINFDDNNNMLSSRPKEVNIVLYRDGEKVKNYIISEIDKTVCYPSISKIMNSNGEKIAINSTSNSFTYTFSELQKYSEEDNHEYVYTITMDNISSNNNDVKYITTYSTDTFTITNKMVNSGEKKMTATVKWIDESNTWLLRPQNVVLTLLKTDVDTKEVTSVQKTIVVGSQDSFEVSFENLDAINANGNLYKYSIIQGDISLYNVNSYNEILSDNVVNYTFENTLKSLPTSLTGGEGNKLTIAADAFDFEGHYADKNDYFAIDSNEELSILVTLKEIKKNWTGTGSAASELYDNDTYTGRFYNLVVSPNKDVIVENLYDGRYEVIVSNSSLFDFDKFAVKSEDMTNVEFLEEDGRYFITYSSKHEYSAILNLHAQVLLKPWRGYTCIKEIYREKDWTIIG